MNESTIILASYIDTKDQTLLVIVSSAAIYHATLISLLFFYTRRSLNQKLDKSWQSDIGVDTSNWNGLLECIARMSRWSSLRCRCCWRMKVRVFREKVGRYQSGWAAISDSAIKFILPPSIKLIHVHFHVTITKYIFHLVNVKWCLKDLIKMPYW